MVAEKLGMDPLEIRRKNVIRPEDLPYKTSTGQIIRSCGVAECLEKAAKTVGWGEKRKANRGVGIAAMIQWTAPRASEYGANSDFGSVIVKVNEDGTATVLTGACEIGTGINTALIQIVAEELGLHPENVSIICGDTDATPADLGCWGSRSALVSGSAAKRAASNAKKRLLEAAASILGASPEDLEVGDGKVYVRGTSGKEVTIKKASHEAYFTTIAKEAGPIIGVGNWDSPTEKFDENGCGNYAAAYAFAANATELEVDPETGHVKLIKFVQAHDVGKAINPDLVEGQIQGGAAQGIGYALLEEMVFDLRTGRLLNDSFTDYKIPTAADLPMIEPIIVETSNPTIPSGAKGVGETAYNCAAASIASAIYAAIGVRFKELPITPEKIVKALKEKSASAR
jgi:CO/xanthine dehydrogenase Mo-binding subunit